MSEQLIPVKVRGDKELVSSWQQFAGEPSAFIARLAEYLYISFNKSSLESS